MNNPNPSSVSPLILLKIEMAIDRLGLSARAHSRILKVARTIADLEWVTAIRPSHVAEEIQSVK